MNRFTTHLSVLAVVSGLGVACLACKQQEQAPPPKLDLQSEREKISYVIGQNVGRTVLAHELDVDLEIIMISIEDALAKRESQMTPAEERATKALIQRKASELRERAAAVAGVDTKGAEENRERGEKFLAENGKKKGIVTTKSGLQYQELKRGKGKTPGPSDRVKVHYRGTLIDGTEFDSSYNRNRPTEFRVDGVISGWTEALQLMKTGAKWKLYIPSELAYGRQSQGKIPANSVLIFEVELLEIMPKERS